MLYVAATNDSFHYKVVGWLFSEFADLNQFKFKYIYKFEFK